MPESAFRQFLFHLKWSLWVIVVTCAAAGGIWWLLGRQGWFGVGPVAWMNLNVVVLLIAVAVFIPLTMLLRSNETRDLLQKCLLFSIFLHVLITMVFSVIFVSRDVIHYVKAEMGMEVPINLEASRAAELQLQVRNQITNLPVATPQAGGDVSPQSAIEIAIEPPRPIQTELPRNFNKPAPMSLAPEAPAPRAPRPAESVALAVPSAAAPIPQLEIPLAQMRQAEAAAPPPPAINSSRIQLPFVAAAPQPMVTGNLPIAQPRQSLASELPLSREGTPKAEPLDIHPRMDLSEVPQVFIPTLPVAPITGAEVQTLAPPMPQSPHIAPTRSKPGSISIGSESSSNPIASTSILDQPITNKLPPSFTESPAPALPSSPQLDIKIPELSSSTASSEPFTSPDFIEAPRPTISASSSGSSTGRAAPIKAANIPSTTFDQWAPQQPVPEAIKPRIPDLTPEPIQPKVTASLPEELGPRQVPTETLIQRSDDIRKPLVETLGGSKATEDAVARALDYLSRNQEPDGRWTRFNSDRTPHRRRQEARDVALTGLATLAFLASDHTPDKPGLYQDTVRLALKFLLEQQRNDGSLKGAGGDMYDQAIATIALSEAAIMTRDPAYQRAAFKGAEYLMWAHHRRSGGWRYMPNQSADTSVTGWSIMALHSAQQAGFDVPASFRTDTLRWLNSVSSGPNRVLVGYQDPRKPTETMTAQATFTRMLLGQQLTSDQIDEVCRFVTRFSPSEYGRDFYHWYYVSLMLMQTQNDTWKTWNTAMTQHLLSLQRGDGHANGSWDSDGLRDDPGGRIFSTAMATLTLEVYYRYLPMYAARSKR
ncbi:MAG TPA: hypothetical protein VGQ99_07550 [Tepidisphaeraceae bacterium]|jgi:hypothetical protein|nr:hypothetical protein [Tepidisphaeraceae bacterium]